MTTEMQEQDEFDVLLNDVLRTVANPELPERVRVQVRTQVWVREMKKQRPGAVVFAPEIFLTQMQSKRDARSTGAAVLLHVAAIALLFWAVASKGIFVKPQATAMVDVLTTPPRIVPAKSVMGGGGGQRGPAPVTKGHLPKFVERQITPPKAPPMDQPKIRMPDPTIEMQKDLKMANNNLPNIGMPNSALLGSSLGNRSGSGIGSGNGAGLGWGWGGNYGAGVRRIGGGISTPVVIYQVEPEFSEEARKAKFMGNVIVSLVVDPKGLPENVHVTRGVGMGLDDKAVEAVKQYRFKPAMEGGKPVAVYLNVEVAFQIF